MSKHKKYLNSVFNYQDDSISEAETKEKKIDGYSSEVYADMEEMEDAMVSHDDLYTVFEQINKVLEKPCYDVIQSMTPKMNVNDNTLSVQGITKDKCSVNEEILKMFVVDLQKASKSKLQFKAEIDEENLDGLNKFQLNLTVSGKQ